MSGCSLEEQESHTTIAPVSLVTSAPVKNHVLFHMLYFLPRIHES